MTFPVLCRLQVTPVQPIGAVVFSNLRLWLDQMGKTAPEKQKHENPRQRKPLPTALKSKSIEHIEGLARKTQFSVFSVVQFIFPAQ